MNTALPYAHGGPLLRGVLRAEAADFHVEEILGFTASGEGEHAFLLVEKTDANTEWVARRLAQAAGVAPLAVGFAGLKDRHAVTRQHFTVHLAAKPAPDWMSLDIAGVNVITATRHHRKLKRGAHRGNRFRIHLREVEGDSAHLAARLAVIGERGVPNYFGEQRFGRDRHNLALAETLFAGRRLPREQRGFALSAARAELFNAVLALRVSDATWDRARDGEVWMLDGSNAIFGPESFTDALAQRLASGDIHPTGPLWGRGIVRSQADVRALELAVVQARASLARGLERAGLEQERRALRLRVDALTCAADAHALTVGFELRAGAFATTVLRELCEWNA
ncbi:MAG: tRNA pseudouridine(13) synthase TruD [Rhodanobacter sp.]|jgi:tRNA pseudouridine13 synthase|nr:tRNA pseudouridine(13) synthase TruD [Rhodanobacter sp.]